MTSAIREFASELRAVQSGKATPALSAGFTSGLGLLAAQAAFGVFIVSGPLAPYTSQGVGLVLFGNFAACLLIALASGYRDASAGLSPALVLGMAVIGSTMAAEGDALFVTTAAALIIAAVTTGAFCLVIGQFRLANVVRFVPYPVAGGFVAGFGGAVCIAALSMMGADPHRAEVLRNPVKVVTRSTWNVIISTVSDRLSERSDAGVGFKSRGDHYFALESAGHYRTGDVVFRPDNNVDFALGAFEALSRGLHALCVRFAAGVASRPRNMYGPRLQRMSRTKAGEIGTRSDGGEGRPVQSCHRAP